MTREELVAAVRLRLGTPDADQLLTDAVIEAAVNEALQEIAAEHDWPWLEASETITTVAGTDTYDVDSEWVRTRHLKPSDDLPLERYPIVMLDDLFPLPTTSGRPVAFAIEQSQLVLRPIPDRVMTLTHRFYKAEPELDGDMDVPLMPAQFHPAIAELATHIVLKRSREDARSAAALESYGRWLSKMHRHRRKHAGPIRTRSRWD